MADTTPLAPTDAEIAALRSEFGITSNGRGIKEFTQVRDFARAVIARCTGDALDAARLDWLTFNLSGKALRDIGVVWSQHGDARRAIDAASAAQEGK